MAWKDQIPWAQQAVHLAGDTAWRLLTDRAHRNAYMIDYMCMAAQTSHFCNQGIPGYHPPPHGSLLYHRT